ncbi:transcriptional activator NhaR [Thalassotalea sp. LPB0316]|uniref:transcriptional activator NhaR n=1 Tax=Thalassotalea sp. LPB0316 TaxID=2769490 RepID=UPI0018685158|nr:transcriptional activator NhaR [Thalassotalea sp. LPB0316]QOL25088.1 transcriptional activator NhaR [Thalassotalea sp. LPB0316]
MKQLNYNHLYYFYLIAKEGSIANACKILHLTPQTVSGQLATLEDYLGIQLFTRIGKKLILNEHGKLVLAYAEDIFSLGHELLQNLEPSTLNQKLTFTVGITDVIPKVFSYEFLKPVLDGDIPIKLVCREGELDYLLAQLALNKLDVILSDCPIPPGRKIKAYNHKTIESGLTFYIAKNKVATLEGGFPACLNQQKLLIPGEQSSMRISVISWLKDNNLKPNIVAEFDDSALTKLFGQAGYGIFCTPTIVERHVLETYQVEVVGRTEEIKEQLYLITSERKFKHPALVAISEYSKVFNQ